MFVSCIVGPRFVVQFGKSAAVDSGAAKRRFYPFTEGCRRLIPRGPGVSGLQCSCLQPRKFGSVAQQVSQRRHDAIHVATLHDTGILSVDDVFIVSGHVEHNGRSAAVEDFQRRAKHAFDGTQLDQNITGPVDLGRDIHRHPREHP
ncbi:hypothetical protein D3C77_554630 [compost metagenome]